MGIGGVGPFSVEDASAPPANARPEMPYFGWSTFNFGQKVDPIWDKSASLAGNSMVHLVLSPSKFWALPTCLAKLHPRGIVSWARLITAYQPLRKAKANQRCIATSEDARCSSRLLAPYMVSSVVIIFGDGEMFFKERLMAQRHQWRSKEKPRMKYIHYIYINWFPVSKMSMMAEKNMLANCKCL